MTTKNEYVSKDGTKIELDLANNQISQIPGHYVFFTGDDMATAGVAMGDNVPLNKHGIPSTHLIIKELMRPGYEKYGLNINDFTATVNVSRPAINKGTNPEWLAKYEAIQESLRIRKADAERKRVVADKTDIVSKFRTAMERATIKAGQPLNKDQVIKAIEGCRYTPDQKEVLKVKFIDGYKATAEIEEDTYFDFF